MSTVDQLRWRLVLDCNQWRRAFDLGRALSDSNSSINYFDFPAFSVIWGICFSLKANPNGMKRSDSGALLARGTRLRDDSDKPIMSPRGRLKETLNFRVEVFRDRES